MSKAEDPSLDLLLLEVWFSEPAAMALSGSFLEIQTLRVTPDLLIHNLYFNKIFS